MGPIKQKLSRTQKNKKDKQWYKDNADYLDTLHFGSNLNFSFWKKQDKLRMKINYDLYNNILNEEDFRYVCKPLGEGLGELPARMVNRDIISPKVKAVLGMEKKMPFLWRAIAVNPEATTQREQEYFKQIMAMVQQKIMEPIKQQLTQQKAEQDPESGPRFSFSTRGCLSWAEIPLRFSFSPRGPTVWCASPRYPAESHLH